MGGRDIRQFVYFVEKYCEEREVPPDQRGDFRLQFKTYFHRAKQKGVRGSSNSRGDFTEDQIRELLDEFFEIQWT